jgi:hypothetical protein
MSESLGNDFGYLCPACKRGDRLQILIPVWSDLTPDGHVIEPSDDEWDQESRARCGCEGFDGLVRELIHLPEAAGPVYECQDCGTEWAENQCNEARDLLQRLEPGDIYTDKECPSCGALCQKL